MWLQKAESRSHEENLLGRTERAEEEDALPARTRAWAMMSSNWSVVSVMVDPECAGATAAVDV